MPVPRARAAARGVQAAGRAPREVQKYKGILLDCGYRADLVVEERVIVEIKTVDRLAPIHVAQVLTYLKVTGADVGLLVNFNTAELRMGLRRLTRKTSPAPRLPVNP